MTEKQVPQLQELLGYNLRIVRAYLMKEEFERFWDYKSAYWAGKFLHDWCVRAMRSKFEPMKKFVGTIRSHRELLLNWFKSKGLSSGIVEGFNNKVKLTVRKGYGYASNNSNCKQQEFFATENTEIHGKSTKKKDGKNLRKDSSHFTTNLPCFSVYSVAKKHFLLHFEK